MTLAYGVLTPSVPLDVTRLGKSPTPSKEGIIQQILLPDKWNNYTNKVLKKKFYHDLIRTKKLIKKNGKVQFIIAKNSE